MKLKQITIRPEQYLIGREKPITEIEIDFGEKITNFRTRDQEIIKDAAQGATGSTQIKTKKIPVVLRFDTNLLKAIDHAATYRGMSRSAIISFWCSQGLEAE